MVQKIMSLEQCWTNKNTEEDDEEEERQILLPHKAAKKNDNNLVLLHNSIVSYETTSCYENNNEEDELTFVGDPTNTNEDDDDDDGWMNDANTNRRLEDPVGDIITNMLNEGSIPYFGYENYLQQIQQQQQRPNYFTEDISFDWTHILCVRNFSVVRNVIMGAWVTTTNNYYNHRLEGGYSSMKFLQETFLVVLVIAFAISDVVLRTTSWWAMLIFMWVLHMLIDVEELHHGLVELLGDTRTELLTNVMNQCCEYWRRIMETIHMDLLWGDHFHGRLIVWSEEDRLPKFRRKHIAFIRIIKERKQNAKTTRRLERDIKKSRRKGLIEGAAEAAIVNEAKMLLQSRKNELDAAAKELNQKPPTFFPTSVSMQEKKEGEASANNLPRSTATDGHMEALRFCHKMVFLRDQETQQLKQELRNTNDVSITHLTSSSEAVDRIEVVSENFSMSPNRGEVDSDNDSTAYSEFPSIGEHWDSESDGDTESYDDSVSSSEQALPWLAVGAKIGVKLLKSRKLHRVVANPDEIQKTLPNEAMKLIDGMNITDEANELAADMLIAKSKSTERKMNLEKEKEEKQEMKLIKRPIHGMWTSPARVTLTPVKAELQTQGSPSRFAVIEMPTSFNDTSISTPTLSERLQSGLLKNSSIDVQQKQINRLAPIEKGVRIIVPLFSPDPNISINVKSNSFYQMVGLVFAHCALVSKYILVHLRFLFCCLAF